jgi:integrative and conjugative element protein (TIGR02256 family)
MITLILPNDITESLFSALTEAKHDEVGGVLMGEHVGLNQFRIHEITIHSKGSRASFLRRIEDAIFQINSFFKKTAKNYRRFNYIGEWHSHPLFEPFPSRKDDESMLDIIQDSKVGANFVVLLIVKLDSSSQVIATAHTYLPDGTRHNSKIQMEA